jgi:pimeloyl-ACP methyl ester carboxylesterase
VTHRVILPDQCGTGLSKPGKYNRATLNLDKLVEDLAALRMHLGLRKLNLMGHSWGGMLAMPYTAVHPNRIESMVLVGIGGMDLAFLPLPAAGTAARLKLVLPPEEQKRLETLMATTAAPPMPEQVKSERSHLRSAAMFYDRRRAEAPADRDLRNSSYGLLRNLLRPGAPLYRNVRIVPATSSDRKS